MTGPYCSDRWRVDGHFDGSLSPLDERAMREHLPMCVRCAAGYERHLVLETLDPAALGPRRRIGRGLGFDRPPARSVARWAAPAGVLALAASVFVVLGAVGPRASRDSAFTARGAATTSESPAVFVYRAVDHGPPSRAGSALNPDDELAFAYENPSEKAFLMVFGVDEHRRVVWYYPAWSRESDDPRSIRIETTPGRHRLPDAIAHDLDGRSLEIHAIFSNEPLSARNVERLIVASPKGSALGASIPGTVERSMTFTIER